MTRLYRHGLGSNPPPGVEGTAGCVVVAWMLKRRSRTCTYAIHITTQENTLHYKSVSLHTATKYNPIYCLKAF
jgi:hypothetical protein